MAVCILVGVTVGNMDMACHPLVEGSPIVLIIFFLSSGAMTFMCYQLLVSCCRGHYLFYLDVNITLFNLKTTTKIST